MQARPRAIGYGLRLGAVGILLAGCGSPEVQGDGPSPAADLAAVQSAPGQHGPRVTTAYPESSRPELARSAAAVAPTRVPHPRGHNPNLPAGPIVEGPRTPQGPMREGPVALQSFIGQGETLSPSTITGTPPDPDGAVGPNHYVQAVNGGLAIWSKSGKLLWGSQPLNVLWAGYVGTNAGNQCATRNDGDAVVLYDQLADRWVVAQFSVPNKAGPDYQCVAVSKTGDPTPTAGYWLYDFEYPFFNDYGKFGIWPDAYTATFNDFTHKYGGTDLCAWDRASMLAGKPATQQCFEQPASVFGVLPVSMDGKVAPPRGEPGFFMSYGTNSLNLWKLHVDWTNTANTVLSGPTSIPVNAFTAACNGGICIPQPGKTNLDSLADRLMFRLAYRNYGTHESLVVNHSVALDNVSGVRWYEIRSPASAPTVYQQGTYEPGDGNWRWMGSIAQDQAQGFGLGFSLSSGTTYASIAWTGRVAGDPLGTMGQGETLIAAGTATETGANRWGDYSAMTVDPSDDCTFWYTNEYYQTQGASTWDTRIGSFKLPGCAANDFTIGVAPTPQSVMDGGQVTYTVTTTVAAGTPETIALNVQDLPSGVTAAFTPASVTAGSSAKLTLQASASAPLTPTPTPPFTVIGTAPSAVHPAIAQVAVVTTGSGTGGATSASSTVASTSVASTSVASTSVASTSVASTTSATTGAGTGGTTGASTTGAGTGGTTGASTTGAGTGGVTGASSTGAGGTGGVATSSATSGTAAGTGGSTVASSGGGAATGSTTSTVASTGAGTGGAGATSSVTTGSGTGGSHTTSSAGSGTGGSHTAGAGAGGGTGGGATGPVSSNGHCSCETPGAPAGGATPFASFGVLALASALRARRRRS